MLNTPFMVFCAVIVVFFCGQILLDAVTLALMTARSMYHQRCMTKTTDRIVKLTDRAIRERSKIIAAHAELARKAMATSDECNSLIAVISAPVTSNDAAQAEKSVISPGDQTQAPGSNLQQVTHAPDRTAGLTADPAAIGSLSRQFRELARTFQQIADVVLPNGIAQQGPLTSQHIEACTQGGRLLLRAEELGIAFLPAGSRFYPLSGMSSPCDVWRCVTGTIFDNDRKRFTGPSLDPDANIARWMAEQIGGPEEPESNQEKLIDNTPQYSTPDPAPAAEGDNTTDAEGDSIPSDYPTPENYERDKWIYEQRKAGRTIPQIIDDLANNKRRWGPLNADNSIREAEKRYATFHGLRVQKMKPGKPRTAR